MRIAFLTTEYTTESNFSGGLANYLHRTCLGLKSMGHDPEIIVTSNKAGEIVSEGIKIHRINAPVLSENKNNKVHPWLISGRLLNNKLYQLHNIKKYDIAQYSNWMATGIFRLHNIPSVTRISSFQPLWFSNNVQTAHVPTIEERFERMALNISDAVYSPSNYLAKFIESFINKRIDVIETPFEIEIKTYDYSVYNKLLKNKKYLLFFGKLDANKGIKEIECVVDQVLRSDTELFFVFVGNGVISDIKKAAKENSDRVIHISAIGHDLLYPIIARSYAVVIPSRVDNLPNACLEAMAHGKIVIASKGASFEQLIEDGVNGFLANNKDPIDLQNKLIKCLKIRNSEKASMERKALKIISRLRPSTTLTQLVKYYQSVIKDTSNTNKTIGQLREGYLKYINEYDRLELEYLKITRSKLYAVYSLYKLLKSKLSQLNY